MNTHKNPELSKFLYDTFLDTKEGQVELLDGVMDYCNSNGISKPSEDWALIEEVLELYKQGFVRNQDLQFLIGDLEDTKNLNFLLSERQLDVYTMKEKNVSYQDISEKLEITESTARDHFKVAKDKILKRLKEDEKIRSFFYRNRVEDLIKEDSSMLNYRILEEPEDTEKSRNGGDYYTAIVFAYLEQTHSFVVYIDKAYKSDFAKQNITLLLTTSNPVEARLYFAQYQL